MSDRSRLRLVVLRVLVLSLVLTLLGRLWYLQVLAGPDYAQAAADNQVRSVVTAAPRGQILDDRGRAFVDNRTALVVSVDRVTLQRQRDSGAQVLQRLSGVLHLPVATLQKKTALCGAHPDRDCWRGSPYQPIPVTQLTPNSRSTQMALQILERKEDFPGVTAELAAVRNYKRPGGALASEILGYLAPITEDELKKLPSQIQDERRSDLVGRGGLEQTYDAALRGRAGVKQVAVDHVGAVTGVVKETPPTPGNDLVTSLDATVQASLEKELAAAITRAHGAGDQGGPADFAAGVVLDAQTGHVVAMASVPTYDPESFVGGISQKEYDALLHAPGSPLLDKTYASAFPPGSTFKLISTSGLLHDGTASLDGAYECSSDYKVGNRTFRNFEGEFFGAISLRTTIIKSCDTVFYRLAYADWLRDNHLVNAKKNPVEGVQAMARAFGLGATTGVDLPGETTGHIADRNNQRLRWEQTKGDYCSGAQRRPASDPIKYYDAEYCKDGWRFNPGDQLNEDIGQGTVLVSPLQLAAAYAALANGGTVFSPRLGEAELAPDGHVVKTLAAPVRSHVTAGAGVLNYIRSAMYGVPRTGGTASGAFTGFPFDKVAVGGKTGTAEVGVSAQHATAWFASFAGLPGQKPRYVAVVMVDKGGQGGAVAAPAVRHIWDTVFGVEGRKAAMPGGHPPALPRVAAGAASPASVSPVTPSSPAGPPTSAISAAGVPAVAPERTRVRR